ncbi:MAG: hypothetical protein ACOCVF_02955 [bacterium]
MIEYLLETYELWQLLSCGIIMIILMIVGEIMLFKYDLIDDGFGEFLGYNIVILFASFFLGTFIISLIYLLITYSIVSVLLIFSIFIIIGIKLILWQLYKKVNKR